MLDDNINLKIELFKDSESGKMALRVHFDDKAPNITLENNEFYWKPTIEEEKILHEAFNILSTDKKTENPTNKEYKTDIKSTSKNNTFNEPKIDPQIKSDSFTESKSEPQIKSEKEVKPEPIIKSDIKNESKEEIKPESIKKSEPGSEIEQKDEIETNPKEEILHAPKPMEKTKKHIFGFKREEESSFNEKKSSPLEPKVEVKSEEKTKSTFEKKVDNDNFFKDNPLVSDSNNNEVEDILKKHDKDEDDASFKEADEKTILDRVLNQKKKGKWKRK